MHTLVTRPKHLTPQQLDAWLAKGWYRVRQVMMTCRFMMQGQELRSTIWTRVPLRGADPLAPSHRKRLRRVEREFRLTLSEGTGDERHQSLYERYLTVARGERPPTLHDFLYGDSEEDIFDTHCLSLWRGERLAAFSYVDIGRRSAQSLLGAYDPAFARYSLGLMTLLLEIRWARQQSLDHYYAGYVVPGGAPSMDYKLRPRGVELLDPATGRWRPWDDPAGVPSPSDTLHRHLRIAARALAHEEIPTRLLVNDRYTIGVGQPPLARCLAEPLAVDCKPRKEAQVKLLVTWDLDEAHYDLIIVGAAKVGRTSDADDSHAFDVWVVIDRLASAYSPQALVEAVKGVLRP